MYRFVIFFLVLVPALLAVSSDTDASEALFAKYRDKGLVVSQEADMAPMSFKGPNGEAKGYVVDLWRKWSAETGIPIRFYLVDWADTLTAVRDGKADVHGGLFYTPERDKYLDYSLPFFPSKGGVFVRSYSSVTDIEQLDGKAVGVIASSFYHNYIRKRFPKMIPVPIKTAAELVEAVSRGDVDAFLADYPTLMYQIGSMGKSKQFKVIAFVSEQEFRAAVAEGNAEVLAVVEGGLALLDQSERDTIFNRWIVGDNERSRGWLLTTVVSSVVVLLFVVMMPFVISRFRA